MTTPRVLPEYIITAAYREASAKCAVLNSRTHVNTPPELSFRGFVPNARE